MLNIIIYLHIFLIISLFRNAHISEKMTANTGILNLNFASSPDKSPFFSSRLMTVDYDKNWDLKDDGKISPSIIPNFLTPVYKWTSSVIRILNAVGIRNLNAPQLGIQIIPVILTRLPNEISKIIPINNLEQMLDFLLNYDKEKPSWTNFSAVNSNNSDSSV